MSSPPPTKVLLVDDDPDVLRLLALRVSSAGYAAIPCTSGAEALARLDVERARVVVTDLRMDGMDGMALFEAIHQRHPALPVIILTAHGSIPEAVAATRSGVHAFLTKPFDGKALLAEIEAALRTSPDQPSAEAWRRGIVTRNPRMEEVLTEARLIAESDAAVLLRGASGTGKELVARAIHSASPRRDRPFVAVNCAAIPEGLLESELFGHVRGAFTGASRDYPGLFGSAEGGTLFLDEIGDMPQALQAKLLRVLADKEVRPLGSTRAFASDVRIIAATHRDLPAAVAEGRFREDLYYRLDVAGLELPPLEQRREDIPLIAVGRLAELSASGPREVKGFAPEALELLTHAPWPGNVRQLLNVVEQAYVLCTTPIVPASLVRRALRSDASRPQPLEEARTQFERDYLVRILKLADGKVTQAARLAGRNRTDFYKLLARHAIDPSAYKPNGGSGG